MMRESLGLPPLYTCCVCSGEVALNSSFTLRAVRAWVRNGKRTIVHVIDEEPTFAHEACLERGSNGAQESLF